MNANKLLRQMRVTGLYIFFGNTFLQSTFSTCTAFSLFYIFGVSWVQVGLFDILTLVMLLGFLLMFLGSMLQRKFKKLEIKATNLGELTSFYEQQKVYGEPEQASGKGTFKFFGIALAWFAATFVLYNLKNLLEPGNIPLIFATIFYGFYQYAIAICAVCVAFLVALIAGNVNEDVFRLYIKGYHVHESLIGLYFALIGVPLMAYNFFSLEFGIGLAYLVAGIFLVGRAWRDVVKGNLLVHKSREPDYDDYMKLKTRRI